VKRILVLGGAGAIGRHAVGATLACSLAGHTIVADRDGAAAAKIAELHPGCAEPLALDLFDETALRAAMRQADAVINCAGPFWKTSLPALKAAIAERKTYLDVCDGWETTHELLALDEEARSAGIAAIIGLGGAPGITNLLAKVAAQELDSCDTVTTISGIDPDALNGGSGAPARAIHWARQIGADVAVWRGGVEAMARPLQHVELDLPHYGKRMFHLIGHPEALTLPRAIPGLKNATHVLALSKREGALAESLAKDVASGGLTAEQAAEQIANPGKRPLGLKLEMGWNRLKGGFERDLPAFFALASGMRLGKPQRVMAALNRLPPGGAAGAAAAALAVGLEMALAHRVDRLGVSPPESAIDPHIFFEEYAHAATPRGTAPGPLLEVEMMEGA